MCAAAKICGPCPSRCARATWRACRGITLVSPVFAGTYG
ncbi:DUF3649 domain-containing protein [Bradyrhizobium sp. CIR18]